MGDPNASIPTPQPVYTRPMFSSFGKSLESSSVTFVSKDSLKLGNLESLKIAKNTIAVENTRNISKKDMVFNNYCPDISVDPETYEVTADGNILTCEPASELPLAQRYFLF
jgi:urease subunit alpha